MTADCFCWWSVRPKIRFHSGTRDQTMDSRQKWNWFLLHSFKHQSSWICLHPAYSCRGQPALTDMSTRSDDSRWIIGPSVQDTHPAWLAVHPTVILILMFDWMWLVTGVDLLWEKSISGWLVAGADLIWEKNNVASYQQNIVPFFLPLLNFLTAQNQKNNLPISFATDQSLCTG